MSLPTLMARSADGAHALAMLDTMRALPGRPQDETSRALTREEMPGDRARRILEATAELVGEHGYSGFKIEDLIRRAGVGLPTVRKRFGDKRGCYLALLDCAAEEAESKCREGFEAQRGRQAAKRAAAIEGLFELAAANPATARACLIEPFAAGPEAIERYRKALTEIARVLQQGRTPGSARSGAAKALEEELMAAAAVWLPAGCLLDEEAERIGKSAGRVAEFVGALQVGGGKRDKRRTGPRAGKRAPTGNERRDERDDEAALGPLPAGRHRLPHAAVKRSQRERLLAGVASATTAKGYPALTVSDVIDEARVSRRVFYELFEDKEGCFLAAWEVVAAHVGQLASGAAASEEGDPPRQVIAALGAVLDFLATEPELARFCLVEGLAAGVVGVEHYREAVGQFAAALRETGAAIGSPPEGTEELLLGALAMALSLRIATEGSGQLPKLAPALGAYLLGPYLGAAEAMRVARAIS